MKKNKPLYKIPQKMFKGKRKKICLVLIDELTKWKSTTKVSEEEFCELVERLYKVS